MRAVDILNDLQDKAKGIDRPNMKQLTFSLKAAKFQYGAKNGIRGWYAKEK